MLSNAKAFTLVSTLFFVTIVNAHGHVAKWTLADGDHAGFNPSNAAELGATAERPTDNQDQGFADYTSTIVACGGASPGSGLETWDITAGDSVTAHWNTWPDSHKGPVTEYMAACPSTGCDGVDASSLQWFKIAEDTFDGSKWPSDTIVSTLAWTFNIPTELAAGAYLVRHEILAMHTSGAPQVYPVCFQANLASSGSVVPTQTTAFPAAYDTNDDFKTWNIYNEDNSQFVPPGPAVFNSAGSGSLSGAPVSSAASTSTVAAPTSPASSYPPTSAASTVTSSEAEEATGATSSTTDDSASDVTATTASDAETMATSYAESTAVDTSATVSSSSAAATAGPTTGPGNAEMGGAAPPVTQNGSRWETLGGSYNDEQSAVVASCMAQMNRCKTWANSQPNSEVSAALTSCDTQESTCESTGASSKRAIVMSRYAKKGLPFS
ncbi:uncharacterized protein IL334_007439 [Kwoniella shivajii]|uniref:lytic cellulose monooxygenase (C4-dehydrogenating) n=1 Tax=Kwoniella shivajii TaxID=564305 RepID=A0ABZ1D9G8_9TREE|nr:hypothetical protein IL334_007439 [Kwoniella shivajii]